MAITPSPRSADCGVCQCRYERTSDKAGNTHFYELDLQKSNATYLEGVGLVTTKNPIYRKVDISADVETQNIHLEGTQELLADSLMGTVDQDALLQEARESLGWVEIGEGELQLKDYTQPDRTYLTQTGEEKPHC